MARGNYSDWQKSRIAQLEQINEALEARFQDAETAAYNKFKREERRRGRQKFRISN